MLARFLSNLTFWLIMAVLIPAAAVFVVVVYLPFIVLKAVWLTLTGNLHTTTSRASERVART
jgi:hypothetical protein